MQHRRSDSRTRGRVLAAAGLGGVTAALAVAPGLAGATQADPVVPTTQLTIVPGATETLTSAATATATATATDTATATSTDTASDATEPDTSTDTSTLSTVDSTSGDSSGDTTTASHISTPPADETTTTSEPAMPDFGAQKIRVGVGLQSGAVPPAGVTTGQTTLSWTVTNEDGSPDPADSSTCQTGDADSDGVSVCPDVLGFPPVNVPAGDTLTVHQQTVNDGLTTASDVVVGPCLDDDSGLVPLVRTQKAVRARFDAQPAGEADYPSCSDQGEYNAATESYLSQVTLLDGVTSAPTTTVPVEPTTTVPVEPTTTPVEVTTPAGPAAPIARDDTASTTEGDPVTIDVLANDTYDGTTSVIVDVPPGHGSASVVDAPTMSPHARRLFAAAVPSAMQVTYTPQAGFTGTDTFTYTLINGGGVSQAKVTVTVTPSLVGPSTTPATTAPATTPIQSGTVITVPVTTSSTSHGTLPTSTHRPTSTDPAPVTSSSDGPHGPLSDTGTDVAALAGAGSLLLVAGAGLTRAARGRRGRHAG